MWIITEDLVEDGRQVGISSCNYDVSKSGLLIHRFRLLDDDGEVCFEGISDDCDSQRAFAPLDDFGESYAGCTEIRYFDGQTWNRL